MFHEERLVEECKKNNPIAQKELYDIYADVIMAICYRYTGNIAVAEDLMQDSLIKVLTRINKFKWMNNGSFKAWVKKITVNTCLSYLEKKQKVTLIELDEDSPITSDVIDQEISVSSQIDDHNSGKDDMELINEAALTQEEMLNALTQVPESFRTVFNLHIIEGYKHEEISGMLKINTKTSKTRLFRARKVLKEILYEMSVEKIKKN